MGSSGINMHSRALLSLLLSVAPALAIPPPDFGFPEAPNHTELSVTYRDNGNPIVVTEAELFGVGITANEPTVALETANYDSIASYNGSYVLLMVDPDARYPSNPNLRFIVHWLQTDMIPAAMSSDGTSQLMDTTAPRVPYARPSPPTNSSAHRYIIYTFFQHGNFSFPSAFEGYSATNRTSFNVTSSGPASTTLSGSQTSSGSGTASAAGSAASASNTGGVGKVVAGSGAMIGAAMAVLNMI